MSVPLYTVPDLSPEERIKYQTWVQDRAVRELRDRGLCEEGNRILRAVFGTPIGLNGVPNDTNGQRRWCDSDGADCFNRKWRDSNGFDQNGLDEDGYNRDGFNAEGLDRAGFNAEGLDRAGIHRDSPDRYRYNEYGYTWGSMNHQGRDREGHTAEEAQVFYIFDADGRDKDGYNRSGERTDSTYNRDHNYHGYPRRAYNRVRQELGLPTLP